MQTVRIATFNVNSVRSRMPVLQKWLAEETAPDIVCFQETKCRDEEFPAAEFEALGYVCNFRGMKSYNGVAVISRTQPDEVSFGLGDEPEEGREESENARVVCARFGDFNLVNSYVPQGKEITHPDYPYKLRFFKRIKKMFETNYTPQDKLLWVGDLNVARTAADIANPKGKEQHVCFAQSVRDALSDVMDWGLTDIFRLHRPGEGEFTFWDYRVKNSLERNIGWRIDHLLATKSVAESSTQVIVERRLRAEEKPSDHTAVVAEFKF